MSIDTPNTEPPILEVSVLGEGRHLEGSHINITLIASLPGVRNKTALMDVNLYITNFPKGSEFNIGYYNGTVWLLNATEVDTLQLTFTPPRFYSGDIDLVVVASHRESTREGTVHISVEPVVNQPTLTVEDTCLANMSDGSYYADLLIDSNLADQDGSENLTILIVGIPTNANLSVGEKNEDGDYVLTNDNLRSSIILQLLNTNNEPLEITINITAISKEQATEEVAYSNYSIMLSICVGMWLRYLASYCLVRASRYLYRLIDINECELGTHLCAQECSDTLRSYACGCKSGYELDSDGYSCNSKSH